MHDGNAGSRNENGMIEKLFAYIKKLVQSKFYGKIIITLQHGKLVHLEKRKTEDMELFR